MLGVQNLNKSYEIETMLGDVTFTSSNDGSWG